MLLRTIFIATLAVTVWMPAKAGERPDQGVGKAKYEENSNNKKEEPLIALPRVIKKKDAKYPEQAFEAGLEAVVKLEILVGSNGKVEKAKVVQPAGHGFDEAAVQALLHYEFEPARTKNGPVPVTIMFDYHFTLKEKKTPAKGIKKVGGGVSGKSAGSAESHEKKAALLGRLEGKVLEAGARLPLAGVEVSIRGKNLDTITGASGSFSFDRVGAGSYMVSLRLQGFEAMDSKETVKAGKATQVLYYMRRAKGTRYETIVRAKRKRREVTIHEIDREEVEKSPGTFGDPVRVVQNFPGVARAPFGLGLIAVRGASPADTGIFVDGHEVPLLFHFLGGPSVLPFEIVDSVDFYPGGTGPAYGNKMAGIVNVRTRPGRRERYFGQADIDLIDAGAILEGPLGDKGSIIAGVRRSYIDALLPLLLPSDVADEVSVAPRYWDYQAKYDYRDKGSSLGVFVFGSDDLLTFLKKQKREGAAKRDDFYMRMMWHRLLVDWKDQLTDGLSIQVSPGFMYSYNRVNMNQNNFKLHVLNLDVRTELKWKLSDSLAFSAGLEGGIGKFFIDAALPINWQGLNFPRPSFTENEPTGISVEGSGFRVSPYLEVSYNPVEKLTLLPGIRFDGSHFHGTNLWALDPRLTILYKVTEDVMAKTGLGLFSQWPDIPYMVQNRHLSTQRAFQATLGTEVKLPLGLEMDFQVFGKYMFDLVVFDTSEALSGEMSALPFKNAGVGRAWGAELLLRKPLADGLFAWISYTIQRSERKGPDTDNRWIIWDLDQTNILTLVASWEFYKGWTFGARFRLVTGNPYTPVEGAVFDSDQNLYLPQFGGFNSKRLPLFHELDVRLDKRFTFDTWYLSLYLDVRNAYNRRNPEGFQYSFDYSERIDFPGLPIIPTLGIKGEF
ncbi:MAG: TonB-dependent receptor [Deltaproteobacteria bacterium]|nr:TonB-dependent receptor [Deltaproteobacteria bacterium]